MVSPKSAETHAVNDSDRIENEKHYIGAELFEALLPEDGKTEVRMVPQVDGASAPSAAEQEAVPPISYYPPKEAASQPDVSSKEDTVDPPGGADEQQVVAVETESAPIIVTEEVSINAPEAPVISEIPVLESKLTSVQQQAEVSDAPQTTDGPILDTQEEPAVPFEIVQEEPAVSSEIVQEPRVLPDIADELVDSSASPEVAVQQEVSATSEDVSDDPSFPETAKAAAPQPAQLSMPADEEPVRLLEPTATSLREDSVAPDAVGAPPAVPDDAGDATTVPKMESQPQLEPLSLTAAAPETDAPVDESGAAADVEAVPDGEPEPAVDASTVAPEPEGTTDEQLSAASEAEPVANEEPSVAPEPEMRANEKSSQHQAVKAPPVLSTDGNTEPEVAAQNKLVHETTECDEPVAVLSPRPDPQRRPSTVRSLSVSDSFKHDVGVEDIAEMCTHLDSMPEGSAVSYNKALSIPVSFAGLDRSGNRLAITPVWPKCAPIIKENVEGKLGLFSLQTGPKDAVVCPINMKAKCIQDVAIELSDNQCILLDASCSGSMLQNVSFEGGIVVCKGNGCNIIMEGVRFDFCTLVVVDGAAVTLKHCEFKAGTEVGTGICLMAHWAGTRVHASECSFSGGLQCIAVHSGAEFQGRKVQISAAKIQAVEAKDPGSKLALSSSCTVSDVDVQRLYVSSKLYSKGVFVHTEASTSLSSCTITGCVRGVEVATKATATINWCSTRGSLESGFRVDSAGKLVVEGCSSEDDNHGCVVLGLATVFKADAVAVLRSKSNSFQIYSRKGGVAELDNCSAQDGGGNGVWVSGFGGHGEVTVRAGCMQDNTKSGVLVYFLFFASWDRAFDRFELLLFLWIKN